MKKRDAAGKLPIALIAHGKPGSEGRMLDERAGEYVRQARDLARRGWLAVVAMRRGYGGSDGPALGAAQLRKHLDARPLRRRRR